MVMGTAQEKAMQVQYLTVIWVDEQKVCTDIPNPRVRLPRGVNNMDVVGSAPLRTGGLRGINYNSIGIGIIINRNNENSLPKCIFMILLRKCFL
jgi:hypothetical protein